MLQCCTIKPLQIISLLRVVLQGFHRYFGVKVKTVKLDNIKASIYAYPNHTDDGIHLDHGIWTPWISLQDHLKKANSNMLEEWECW